MNLVSKTKAGDVAWKRSLSEIQSLGGFKPAVRTRIRDGSDFHLKAVEALLIDTLKKRSETTKKLAIKRAMKGGAPRDDATDGQADAGGEETDAHPGNAVAIWIADPCDGTHKIGGQWIWDNRGRRKLAVIEDRTVEGIWQAAKDYIPDGRSIREILGALEDPPAGNSVAADWTKMQTDAEVYAFLRMTKANPIRLLLVLHRNDGTPDIPIAGVPNPYFAPNRFEPAEVYDDPAEDCDALVRNHAGVASRRMPTKDHTYEERKYKIRKRIQRQQDLLRMVERSHRAKFPNEVINDSDHNTDNYFHRPGFWNLSWKYVHSFRYRALRPAFTGPVFSCGSTGALGQALPLLSVEAFTVCYSYSPPSPFPGEYLPAPGAEIALWTGVVARAGW